MGAEASGWKPEESVHKAPLSHLTLSALAGLSDSQEQNPIADPRQIGTGVKYKYLLC